MKKAVILFQCVTEALVKQGLSEWARAVPGGQMLTGQMMQGMGMGADRTLCTIQDADDRLPDAGAVLTALQSLNGRGAITAEAPAVIAPTTANQVFTFKTPFVDKKGKIIRQEEKTARYFTEMLGKNKNIPLEMVFIPGGLFQMGAAKGEKEADSWESPQHQVTMPDFYLGKYPVTKAQYKTVMGNNLSHFKGANHPVERVSWEEAVAFCAAVAKTTGKAYRLPSEAEWEYACRASTTTQFCYGETLTADLANYNANYTYGDGPKGEYRQKTTGVGQFPPNGFGLYDMHGNVWEWCADYWHDDYNGAPADGSAWVMGGDSADRVYRGGSWINDPHDLRCADRCRGAVDFSYRDLGFRLGWASQPVQRASVSNGANHK